MDSKDVSSAQSTIGSPAESESKGSTAQPEELIYSEFIVEELPPSPLALMQSMEVPYGSDPG